MNEKYYILKNDIKIPSIGFGTYKSGNDYETERIIKYAIEIGYRHIDTASFFNL